MLWKSDDVPHVHILGSIHFLNGVLPDWVLETHGRADAVVFEADLIGDETLPPSMPDGLSLLSLNQDLWEMVEATARELEIDEDVVRGLSCQYPQDIAGRLSAASLQKAGALFENSPEGALRAHTELALFLETKSEFFRLFYEEPPIAEQVASLQFTLQHLSELPERYRHAAERWRMRDPEAVLAALDFSRLFSDFPGISAGLLANRHKLWLPRADYFIRRAAELKHRLLIVVGCSHLSGPQSFLADLKKYCGYDFLC
jgi:uncharacterized protein YbaP (TraB family)